MLKTKEPQHSGSRALHQRQSGLQSGHNLIDPLPAPANAARKISNAKNFLGTAGLEAWPVTWCTAQTCPEMIGVT